MDIIRYLKNRFAAKERLSDVLADAASRMTAFDWHTAQLCAATYQGADQGDFMWGQLTILAAGLQGGYKDTSDGEGLIRSKADESDAGAELMSWCEASARAVISSAPALEQKARDERVPFAKVLLDLLTRFSEDHEPRPAGGATPGYYAFVADRVFGCGLQIRRLAPSLAETAVRELFADIARRS